METYLVLRRAGWRAPEELWAATARSRAEGDRTPGDIRWLRSYVLAEANGELGLACVFQASSPEAIRAHAYRTGMPVDEIAAVADTVVVRPDPIVISGVLPNPRRTR